jgi:hypothetical protein
LPRVILTADQAGAIAQGRPIEAGGPHAEGEFALIGPDGGLFAIAEAVDDGRRLGPRRVLAAT